MSLSDVLLKAIDDLSRRPGGSVRLADLHALAVERDWDWDGVVPALRFLNDERAVQLESDPDRLGLTDADRDAAIDLAGRARHLVRVVTA